MGAGVKGGDVYAKWPGLDATEEGDLKVTIDYRSVLYEVVKMRFPGVSLAKLFPGFAPERVGVMTGA
jgi:uncharacterized protein (DUF1501 family)